MNDGASWTKPLVRRVVAEGGENLPCLEESVCASKARTSGPTVLTWVEVSLSGFGSVEETVPIIMSAS